MRGLKLDSSLLLSFVSYSSDKVFYVVYNFIWETACMAGHRLVHIKLHFHQHKDSFLWISILLEFPCFGLLLGWRAEIGRRY